ncbi:MAG: hypothetical protein JXB07_01650 [Anaerolineae bacterium]|nr:hypothetical protein [Anaerolineae bacterium]
MLLFQSVYIPEPLGLERSDLDLIRQKYWIENLPEGVFVNGILVLSTVTPLVVMLALGILMWSRIRNRLVWGMTTVTTGVMSLCGSIVTWAYLTGGFWD